MFRPFRCRLVRRAPAISAKPAVRLLGFEKLARDEASKRRETASTDSTLDRLAAPRPKKRGDPPAR